MLLEQNLTFLKVLFIVNCRYKLLIIEGVNIIHHKYTSRSCSMTF